LRRNHGRAVTAARRAQDNEAVFQFDTAKDTRKRALQQRPRT